jgi:hypothetical protein
MFETVIDRAMYDHPGRPTTMTRNIRKWRTFPAVTEGETVTIVRMTFRQEQWGFTPRVLIQKADGGERWVNGSDIVPIRDEADQPAFERMGEIASDILSRRD